MKKTTPDNSRYRLLLLYSFFLSHFIVYISWFQYIRFIGVHYLFLLSLMYSRSSTSFSLSLKWAKVSSISNLLITAKLFFNSIISSITDMLVYVLFKFNFLHFQVYNHKRIPFFACFFAQQSINLRSSISFETRKCEYFRVSGIISFL